ncbi:hypothetical protein ACFU7D_08495 [Nocardioides sp. NPDC057577]|uniref:hypothetical protein n=1 Tax=Nocardioides sp. NPDC057577 TaxID=3346171 RepID=UPI00366D117A
MLIDSNPAALIKVTPSDMRSAAAAWDEARDQVENANPADRVPEIATALQGGAAARQVSALVTALNDRVKVWCDGAAGQGEALRKVTREYVTADQQSADEGRRQESVIGHGFGNRPPEITVSRGPAVFDSSAAPSERIANLDKRMSGRDL